MKLPHRVVTIALAFVLAVGVLALVADLTTIRFGPLVTIPYLDTRTAFPGEFISVQLGNGFTAPETSNREVVQPLVVFSQPSSGWFVAAKPGKSSLQAVSIRCPGCYTPTILWRVTVDVRIPGD